MIFLFLFLSFYISLNQKKIIREHYSFFLVWYVSAPIEVSLYLYNMYTGLHSLLRRLSFEIFTLHLNSILILFRYINFYFSFVLFDLLGFS